MSQFATTVGLNTVSTLKTSQMTMSVLSIYLTIHAFTNSNERVSFDDGTSLVLCVSEKF